MPITINSPYSGLPVKIRDQDISRAVRDEEDRIFYVVPRESGNGYYAAPTRKGSAKDEQRYDAMQQKMGEVQQQVTAQHTAVHDATGRRRSFRQRPVGRLIVLVLLVAALVVAGYAAYVMWGGGAWPDLFGAPDAPLSPLPTDNPTTLPTPRLR